MISFYPCKWYHLISFKCYHLHVVSFKSGIILLLISGIILSFKWYQTSFLADQFFDIKSFPNQALSDTHLLVSIAYSLGINLGLFEFSQVVSLSSESLFSLIPSLKIFAREVSSTLQIQVL